MQKWRLKLVVAHIDMYLDQKLRLADLAVIARMSPMYFANQFRAATGVSPKSFVRCRRIERAQHLLLNSEQSLTEIGYHVGFRSQAHFIVSFKSVTGITPGQWRRRGELTIGPQVKTLQKSV